MCHKFAFEGLDLTSIAFISSCAYILTFISPLPAAHKRSIHIPNNYIQPNGLAHTPLFSDKISHIITISLRRATCDTMEYA